MLVATKVANLKYLVLGANIVPTFCAVSAGLARWYAGRMRTIKLTPTECDKLAALFERYLDEQADAGLWNKPGDRLLWQKLMAARAGKRPDPYAGMSRRNG